MLSQKINLKRPVTGKDLDIEGFENKFKFHEQIKIDLSKLSDDDPKAMELARQLEDNTLDFSIWVYEHFNNPRNNKEPFKVTAYQDIIADCVLKHDFTPMNPNRYILYRASNQAGKSALLQLLALYIALTKTNRNIVIVSNNLKNSQFLITQMKQLLDQSVFAGTWREELGEIANTTHLSFNRDILDENGDNIGVSTNRIICVPAGSGALGYPVHHMFLDEADFYEDGKTFFWGVAEPRTSQTKGQIVLFSNPNYNIGNSASILYELWFGDFFQRKFHFNFLDAPWNTKEEFDRIKRSKASYIFDSTHLGNFPVDGGGFFTQKEINDMMQKDWDNQLPMVDRPIYIALDFAKVKDHTVMGIGTTKDNSEDSKLQDLDIRYMQQFPLKTDYNAILDRVAEVIDYYDKNFQGVANIGFDATGVGKALEDMLRARGISATPVVFSLQSKSKMYANFKMFAEQRRLRIAYDYDCEKQLNCLIFDKTKNGYLQVRHANESDHDDFCFVSGTKVLTDKGQVNIEDLNIGDKVMTRQGYKKITNTGNRISEVITRFGLTGTPDHPFILTNNKIEKFINVLDNIYIWNEKQSYIMEGNIIDTLKTKEDIYEFIIGDIQLGKNPLKLCIETFGKTQTEKYLKDMLFTTEMEIPLTTVLKIWNVCQEENINLNIVLQKKERELLEKIWIKLGTRRKNGINQKKVWNGIDKIIKTLWEKLLNIHIYVKNVMKSFYQDGYIKQDSVVENVVTHSTIEKKERVYNITVEDCNEYFANNILVHNCDAIAIMIEITISNSIVPVSVYIAGEKGKFNKEIEEVKYDEEFNDIWKDMGLI